MSAELLERRRSCSPHTLHTSPGKTRPILHSSFTALEIEEVVFTCTQSPADNHTNLFTPQACHHTLITRRGNTIVLQVLTSAPVSAPYVVSLTFVPYHRPRERFAQFRARGVAKDSRELWLSIGLPSNFPVGRYHTSVSVCVKGDTLTHYSKQSIAVLFDPWNQEDECYVPEGVDDYVLSDVGDILRGTALNKTPLKWEYGQFEDHVLDVALYLISSLSAQECRSSVGVARGVVSRIVTRDHTGVLLKGGGATGATHPCRWNGSTVILQKYHRTKTPVRYGQCWVFAGVAVSLFRALGIATRPVTCFNAAHYTAHPGVVERPFTRQGELAQDLNTDQIWLYHVWVEGWMTRRDLSPDYNGWQVLDPTPQDKQSGHYRIGPVPVQAVKHKKSFPKRGFGCEYVISEVAAVTKYLRIGPRLTKTLAHVSKDEVATEIVTMGTDKTGAAMLLDISNNYREPPTRPHPHPSHFPPQSRDCSFSVSCESVRLGESVTLVTSIANNGALQRTVDGRVVCHVVDYTGHVMRRFASMTFTGVVAPGQSACVSLPLASKQYQGLLAEQAMMLFFVAVKVRENQQLYLKTQPYQLTLPSIAVEAPDCVLVGGSLRVRLVFRNILPSSLTRVLFLVQAGRLLPQRELSSKRLVLPGELVSVELSLPVVACPPGHYTLTASMHSDKLTDIHGHTTLLVTEPAD